jgi:hypothetical protein
MKFHGGMHVLRSLAIDAVFFFAALRSINAPDNIAAS